MARQGTNAHSLWQKEEGQRPSSPPGKPPCSIQTTSEGPETHTAPGDRGTKLQQRRSLAPQLLKLCSCFVTQVTKATSENQQTGSSSACACLPWLQLQD